jgi:hypothetical protein
MMALKMIIISICLISEPPDPAEKIILDKLSDQTKCWNQGDLDCFMEGYWMSDSLMFIGSKVTYGWQQTLDNYKFRYPDAASRGVLDFEILSTTRISAEVYFVIGKYHLTRTIGNASGIFTLVWRKINEDWFIVADHTS